MLESVNVVKCKKIFSKKVLIVRGKNEIKFD